MASMKTRTLTQVIFTYTVVFLSVIATQGQTTEDYNWNHATIKGGGFVPGIVYHPNEAGLAYARTDMGGAYRYDPSDNSWIALTDHLGFNEADLYGVLTLAVDPSDPDRVYMACGKYTADWAGAGAILYSSDRGDTWNRTPVSIKFGGNEDARSMGERMKVDPNNSNIIFLGTSQDGLYHSTDQAQNWSQVGSFPVTGTDVNNVVFDESTGNGTATQIIYATVARSGSNNLYVSNDGGSSWSAVSGQPTTFMPHHMKLSDNGMLYLTYTDAEGPNGIGDGAVWRYNTDNGNWVNVSPPDGGGGFAGLSLDNQDPGTVVVSTMNRWVPQDQVYRSTDQGNSWSLIAEDQSANPGNWDHSPAPYTSASSPHWVGDVEIDPFNSGDVMFVTGYGIWGTQNATDGSGSVNWTFRSDGIEETVPLTVVSPPDNGPDILSALGDIDGFRHDDITQSPAAGRLNPLRGTSSDIAYAPDNSDYVVRVFDEGNMGAYSNDGGQTFTEFSNTPSAAERGGAMDVSADGNTIVWSPEPPDGTTGDVYYSTDDGNSWNAASGISGHHSPHADKVNSSKFYAYDPENGDFYVSTDGGASFTTTVTGLPTVASWNTYRTGMKVTYGREGHIWLANTNGLYRSTNSGSSFSQVSGVESAVKVGFGKAADGASYPAIYILGTINGTMGFYRSDDEGNSWVRINDDQHQYGIIHTITGDKDIYGRVYMGTEGRGIIYGDPATPTPVNMAEFEGGYQNEEVVLHWRTLSENNNSHFVIKHSRDNADYQSIGKVAAGNNKGQAYRFVHSDAGAGVNYYKLVQVDDDGSRQLLDRITVQANSEEWVNIFPNPFEERLRLQLDRDTDYPVTVRVKDVQGRQVLAETMETPGVYTLGQSLSKGVYIVEVYGGNSVKKVFKVVNK